MTVITLEMSVPVELYDAAVDAARAFQEQLEAENARLRIVCEHLERRAGTLASTNPDTAFGIRDAVEAVRTIVLAPTAVALDTPGPRVSGP